MRRFEVIRHLALDDEIAVAGHVLAHSSRLGTDTLVEVATTKGQDHLLAISARTNLPEAVTDVIVDRGEGKVIRKLANNATARFSEAGYSGIVARAEHDEELVEILGLRHRPARQVPARPATARQGRRAHTPAGDGAARAARASSRRAERHRARSTGIAVVISASLKNSSD